MVTFALTTVPIESYSSDPIGYEDGAHLYRNAATITVQILLERYEFNRFAHLEQNVPYAEPFGIFFWIMLPLVMGILCNR
jgi:hypothetical protein